MHKEKWQKLCELSLIGFRREIVDGGWIYPGGSFNSFLPSQDMNSLFEWMVPSLGEKVYSIELFCPSPSWYKPMWICRIWESHDESVSHCEAMANSVFEAFADAIYEIVVSREDGSSA